MTILGGGPIGLAAAYYAGHRHATVRIIESLEQLGGQLAAVYPEKQVYDVAGFPSVLAHGLVERLVEQGLQFNPDIRLGEEATTLELIRETGEELIRLTTDQENTYLSRTLIVTAGHGAFSPRTLQIANIHAWEGKGLHYFVRRKAEFEGKRCVIVGGGDSALDWALGLADVCALPVTLVHRRDRFRGLESSVEKIRSLERRGKARILTPYEVRKIHGDKRVEAVTVERLGDGGSERVACDELVTLLGFSAHLGAMADWGLEHLGKKQLLVDPATMKTSRARIYAAGDIAGYEGKIELITVGLGEAAIAANNAIAELRHEKAQPKYSSE